MYTKTWYVADSSRYVNLLPFLYQNNFGIKTQRNKEKQKKLDFIKNKDKNTLGNLESNFIDKLKQELVFVLLKLFDHQHSLGKRERNQILKSKINIYNN